MNADKNTSCFRVDAAFSVNGRPWLFLAGDVISGKVQLNDLVGRCDSAPQLEGRVIENLESAAMTEGGRKPVLCIRFHSKQELDELKQLDWSGKIIEISSPSPD